MKAFRFRLLAVLMALPASASAQFPGGELVGAERLRYEFVQRMHAEVSTYMRDWERAWTADTRRPLARHYLSDAMVLEPGGRFVRGAEIRAFAAAMREHAADAQTSVADFEASDGIAFTWGPYRLGAGDDAAASESGSLVSVLFKDRDEWYVRAQAFLPADTEPRIVASVGAPLLPPFSLPPGASDERTTRYAEAVVMLAAFRSAWNEKAAARAAALFDDHALLLLPGDDTPARGTAAVAALDSRFPAMGSLTTAILDFDARARVSYLIGRYHVQSAIRPATGTFILVLSDQGDGGRIRAALFR